MHWTPSMFLQGLIITLFLSFIHLSGFKSVSFPYDFKFTVHLSHFVALLFFLGRVPLNHYLLWAVLPLLTFTNLHTDIIHQNKFWNFPSPVKHHMVLIGNCLTCLHVSVVHPWSVSDLPSPLMSKCLRQLRGFSWQFIWPGNNNFVNGEVWIF